MSNGQTVGMKPKEILIVGNGFDIAQGLPTRYLDFLDFLRVEDPANLLGNAEDDCVSDESVDRFMRCKDSIDIGEIKRFVSLRKGNCWVYYYKNCGADIDGWIDFEREMIPVIHYIEWLCGQNVKVLSQDQKTRYEIITNDQSMYRIARLFPNFTFVSGYNGKQYTIELSSKYYSLSYGIHKAKILEDLKRDLDNFIEMFRIYLNEIVSNTERAEVPAICSRDVDALISFNYLKSELWFKNIQDVDTFHIHGDVSKEKNMVLGINEVDDAFEKEYLFFTKSFQRIRIKSNPNYRRLLDETYNVCFFGHSLDMTDAEIIKPFYDKAGHVTVFFYSDTDYEDKVQNLIKMIGIRQIEDDVFNRRLEFVSTCG